MDDASLASTSAYANHLQTPTSSASPRLINGGHPNGVEPVEHRLNGVNSTINGLHSAPGHSAEPSGVNSTPPVPPAPVERITLNLQEQNIDLPAELFQSEAFFRSAVNKEAFYSLSEDAQRHLMELLPRDSNLDSVLDHVFSKSPGSGFIPPLTNFYNKVKAGFYDQTHSADAVQLRDFHKVLHNHFIRNYHLKLLKKLILKRHEILEGASKLGVDEEIKAVSRPSKRHCARNERLRKRTKKRVSMMLSHIKSSVGTEANSSDESGTEDNRVPLMVSREAESTLYHARKRGVDLDLHQPTEISDIKSLLKHYKRLREVNPECPSLDIDGIALEEVYERVGLSYQSEKNYALMRCRKAPAPSPAPPASVKSEPQTFEQ